MAVERQVPSLRIAPSASRALALVLMLVHALAFASFFVAIPQWHWRLLAALVLGANAWWSIRKHALLRTPGAAVNLDFRGERGCAVVCRDGRRSECQVLGSSFVATWLVVLHLDEPGRRVRRYVVLLPDSVEPEPLRRLRIRLRWASIDVADPAGKNRSL